MVKQLQRVQSIWQWFATLKKILTLLYFLCGHVWKEILSKYEVCCLCWPKINYSCSQKWVIQRLLLEQIKIFKIPLERWQESLYPYSRLVIAIQQLGQLSDQLMWEQYLSHLILGFCDIDSLLFFCNFSHTKIQYQNVI